MRRTLHATVGILVVAAQVAHPVQTSHESPATAHPPNPPGLNAGYPRLANYNGFTAPAQAPFFAAYNLVIARRGAPLSLLRALNPHVTALLYERTLQADLCCMSDLYGLDASQVPPQWWLVGAGSRLSLSITPDQDWIPVNDTRPFTACQDILVDGESMHVWGVEGQWLHVLRGYYSTATAHARGARVAPHISYRIDKSNCQLNGPEATLRPWSLNLSSYCPPWHGLAWSDFLARRIADLVKSGGWDGVFFDNLDDLPFSPSADVNNDGQGDGGIVKGQNAWQAGERALIAKTRALLPHRPIIVNGDLNAGGLADGREMEGFPVIPGLALGAAIDSYLADATIGMTMTIVNPDTLNRPDPSAAVAALATGVSLLGDGFATYDQGWINHGDTWWFDPYDDGAGSALRLPVGPWTASLVVDHPWRFRVGDTVLMDQEAAVVMGVTPHTITVERGVQGTAASAHAAGTAVTTVWQRMQGHGYLGLPLGPARVVPTAPWERYALPLHMIRFDEAGATRHHHYAYHTLDAHSTFAVQAHLYYYPDSAGVTLLPSTRGPVLRTLVFSARGPAGQTIWVSGARTAVPLALRAGWHRYVLPIANDSRLTLGTGRAGGTVLLRGFGLYGRQAFVWRRDFTHGIVLVNPTDTPQRVALERPYLPVQGDQDAQAGTGRPSCAVWLDRYSAAILLAAPDARLRCAASRGQTSGQARHGLRGRR